MKANSELHQLIKTLNQTEKTYFKKFSSRHFKENSTFIKLFNELEKKPVQSDYFEDDIKKKFRNEKFIQQLPVTKNYLYNNILKSLNLYYTEDNIEIKLSSIINSAQILYRKELFSQCIKHIAKAKLLAEKFDKPVKLLEAIQVERMALRVNSSLNEVADKLMLNYEEEQEVLNKLKNISDYRKLYDKMVIYATAKGTSTDKHDTITLDSIRSNELLKDYSRAGYFQSKVLFMLMNCFTANLKGDPETSYDYGKKAIELIGPSIENKTIAAYEYVLILQELMLTSLYMGNKNEPDEYYLILLKEQDGLLRHAPNKVRNFLKMRSLVCKLNVNTGSANFEGNVEILNELIKLSKQNENASYRDEVLVTDYLAAVTYFALGRIDDSLFYLNRIFNSKAFELREDIQVSCRIFNLILHYELGHMGSLEYYVKSTYRYLKHRNKLSRFEILVLDFIKKGPNISTDDELVELFTQTKKQVDELSASGEDMRMFDIVDISAWLQSKIEHKSYLTTIKEKAA